MGVSKIEYFGTVKLDLTSDTVTAETLQSGVTAHNKSGEQIVGTLVTQNFRTGSSEPSDSLGDNGDWYLVTEG